ncbi:hypothetical protein L211DRAFT_854445 [Terfezia boudieri ATCC MYA-4762]|uniref:Uncharacterized protein n=1 Tax=Terfezia boudieri ATCC MYA-4762 TaxID=1051890 RepID=A0A3N4LJL7_9PEZI|nr:hypothetical protein L211DRAFT_854445 [Terfezia boudieri ATCC MYA-4762]
MFLEPRSFSLEKGLVVGDMKVEAVVQAMEAFDRSILILTDSIDMVRNLTSKEKGPKPRNVIELRMQGEDAKIMWILGYIGIVGNEKADEMAKKEAIAANYPNRGTITVAAARAIDSEIWNASKSNEEWEQERLREWSLYLLSYNPASALGPLNQRHATTPYYGGLHAYVRQRLPMTRMMTRHLYIELQSNVKKNLGGFVGLKHLGEPGVHVALPATYVVAYSANIHCREYLLIPAILKHKPRLQNLSIMCKHQQLNSLR